MPFSEFQLFPNLKIFESVLKSADKKDLANVYIFGPKVPHVIMWSVETSKEMTWKLNLGRDVPNQSTLLMR
jgi:hypothetical protein